ncbi:hypothetical protein ACHAQH_002443 [Verticillium albo-atrum]
MVVRNYWAYKASQGWSSAVDASLVPSHRIFRLDDPGDALLEPPKPLNLVTSTFEAMALVEAISLSEAMTRSCQPCALNVLSGCVGMAETARRETLEWARSGPKMAIDALETASREDGRSQSRTDKARATPYETMSWPLGSALISIPTADALLRRRFSHAEMKPAALERGIGGKAS